MSVRKNPQTLFQHAFQQIHLWFSVSIVGCFSFLCVLSTQQQGCCHEPTSHLATKIIIPEEPRRSSLLLEDCPNCCHCTCRRRRRPRWQTNVALAHEYYYFTTATTRSCRTSWFSTSGGTLLLQRRRWKSWFTTTPSPLG